MDRHRAIANGLDAPVKLLVFSNRDSFNAIIAPFDTLTYSGVCQGDELVCRVGWFSNSTTEITIVFEDGKRLMYTGNECDDTIGKNINLDQSTVTANGLSTGTRQPFCGYMLFPVSTLNFEPAIFYTIDSTDYSFAR